MPLSPKATNVSNSTYEPKYHKPVWVSSPFILLAKSCVTTSTWQIGELRGRDKRPSTKSCEFQPLLCLPSYAWPSNCAQWNSAPKMLPKRLSRPRNGHSTCWPTLNCVPVTTVCYRIPRHPCFSLTVALDRL